MPLRSVLTAALLLLVSLPVAAQPAIDWGKTVHIEFHARLQTDLHGSDTVREAGEGDLFDLARRRVGIEGMLGRQLEFQVEGEVDTVRGWRDVWVNYRPVRALQVQAGQFKLPFGLEENTSSRSLEFARRSLASTRLAPGRDRGVLLHGKVVRRIIGYEAGLFGHDGDNARPGSTRRVWGGTTSAGRIVVEPFARSKASWSDLEVGVAYARSHLPTGYPAIRGRSIFGESFFPSNVWVAGQRARTGLQARWRPGRFSVASELITVSDDRRGQGARGDDLSAFQSRGWYVSGAWVVMGAPRAASVTQPRNALFDGGFGALQVALRVERFSLGEMAATSAGALSTSPRAERVLGNGESAVTFGATWHPHRWVSIQGNLVREAIGGEGWPEPPLRSWGRLIEVQLGI